MNFCMLAKQNAKRALRERWGGAIAVVVMLCAVFLLFSIFENMVTIFFGLPDFWQIMDFLQRGTPLPAAAVSSIVVSSAFAIISFLVLTPLRLGFTNWLYQLTGGQPREISSLFFFFDTPRLFLKAITLRICIVIRLFFWAVICLLPAVVFTVFGNYLAFSGDSYADHALAAAGIMLGSVLTLLGLAAFWLASFRYFLAGYLLCADPDLGVRTVLRLSVQGTRGRISKLAGFQLSFFGWYLLCLTVLPILYVVPYVGASCAIFARYLIERDDLIPRQACPAQTIVDQEYIDLSQQTE